MKLVGNYRLVSCLSFKTSPGEKSFKYENEFDLHENNLRELSYERFCTRTRFETEVKGIRKSPISLLSLKRLTTLIIKVICQYRVGNEF